MVFVFQFGGLETQGIWLLVLLPAAMPVYPLSDLVYRQAPHAEPIVFWTLTAGLNFLRYWLLSFIVIKIRREFL